MVNINTDCCKEEHLSNKRADVGTTMRWLIDKYKATNAGKDSSKQPYLNLGFKSFSIYPPHH